MTSFENIRLIKITNTFDGTAGNGANGDFITLADEPTLDTGEFIYEVFYRVTTTLTSGDTAGTYLTSGINVDDNDAILNSTTGIIDTLNAGAAGTKPTHVYSKSTIDRRDIVLKTEGTNDITGGTIEIILLVARGNTLEVDEGTSSL